MTRWTAKQASRYSNGLADPEKAAKRANALAYPAKRLESRFKRTSKRSEGEAILGLQLQDAGLTHWEPEYQFAAPRKWRADFAFKTARLLVEVEGGHWTNGRHNRGAGFEADIEKYNAATLAGWSILRFTTQQVKSGIALATITRYLA